MQLNLVKPTKLEPSNAYNPKDPKVRKNRMSLTRKSFLAPLEQTV